MSQIQCVWYERAPRIVRRLRRFNLEPRRCPGMTASDFSYCDASTPLDIAPLEGDLIDIQEAPPHSDPRWPAKCERCGYAFVDNDYWQVFTDWIFRNTVTGEEIPHRELPVGAMFNSHWHRDEMTGPDGLALTVILPDKTPWVIDGYAHNGGVRQAHGWTRSGTPPNVTASPSILTPGYHGHLVNGVLISC